MVRAIGPMGIALLVFGALLFLMIALAITGTQVHSAPGNVVPVYTATPQVGHTHLLPGYRNKLDCLAGARLVYPGHTDQALQMFCSDYH